MEKKKNLSQKIEKSKKSKFMEKLVKEKKEA